MTARAEKSEVPAKTLPPLRRLAQRVAALAGWRRYGLAVLFGACASAALPPLYLVPLLWPAFVGLLWLLDGAIRRRQAFFVGWAFGTGHFLTGLYWIGIAFFVDAERFGMLAPVAVTALAAGMALFPAVAILAVFWSGLKGAARVVLLAGAWLLAEWFRSWMLGGFPWNLIGSVWAFSEPMIQIAALSGIWGLSWLTVLAAAAPTVLGEAQAGRRQWWFAACSALVLPAMIWSGGLLRLDLAPKPGAETAPGVMLRLVQPAIPQALKWKSGMRQQHVARQMTMTADPGFDGVTHVIWAETAVPFHLEHDPELRKALGQIVPEGGYLITGAPRSTLDNGRIDRLWNTIFALDGAGHVAASYDKVDLVPFGEYVPFRGWLDVAKLTTGGIDFSSGEGRRSVELPGLPAFSPLICYEVIFPGRVIADGPRPAWLLSVTNDAWFGNSSGPLSALRKRAPARRRGGPAHGACGQQRHNGGR